ncbi:RICIN domain-containing protein [Streptomyces sp. NPDC017979]|uniref:RICIN domain-containing protein n=1 Tax=unclassified Streptomyces TaxID=2593676 RepID=UPI0037B9D306
MRAVRSGMKAKRSLLGLAAAGAVAAGLLTAPGAQAAQPELYAVQTFADLCFEVRAGTPGAAGAAADPVLVQESCSSLANQQFEFLPAGSRLFQIRNLDTELCLDVKGASAESGARVVGAACGAAPSQRFEVLPNGEGFEIRTFADQCLDVRGVSTTAGAPIVQSACALAKENQMFVIEPIQP